MAKTRAAVVVFDGIGYRTEEGDTLYASKGDAVELTESEFERLRDLGAVEAPKRAEPADNPPATLGDMKVDDLKALADANDVELPPDALKADIVAVLETAGVQPRAAE